MPWRQNHSGYFTFGTAFKAIGSLLSKSVGISIVVGEA